MKKRLQKIAASLSLAVIGIAPAQAYTIGGAYASLVSCTWGQYGNQYGNIGTYNVNGQIHSIFFGSSYCAQ